MYERDVYLLSKLLSSTGRVQTQSKEVKILLCCHIFLEHNFLNNTFNFIFVLCCTFVIEFWIRVSKDIRPVFL